MKQHISDNDLINFLGNNIESNLKRLEDIMDEDYVLVYRMTDNKEFEHFNLFFSICKDFNIGKMIEILQKHNIKVMLDNCIPALVKVLKKDGYEKIYCEMELCDALWNAIKEELL